MVGFIGRQKLISSNVGGAFVESFQLDTLSDGTVLNSYFPMASSSLTFWEIAGPRAEPTQIGSFEGNGPFGGSALRMKDASVFPLERGFGLVINKPTADSTGAQRILYQEFQPNGSPRGAERELVAGAIDDARAFPLSNGGFFLSYHDETAGDGFLGEKTNAFYNDAGREIARFVLDEETRFSGSGLGEAVTLSDGNAAVSWTTDGGQSFTQIFRPNGRAVTDPLPIGQVVAEIPDGGFFTRNGPVDFGAGTITLQRHDNAGRPQGGPTVVDLRVEGNILSGTDPEFAVTRDGLLATVWGGYRVVSSDTDIYLSVSTFDGIQIFGPTNIDETPVDRQSDPEFTRLADGGLMVGWLDHAFEPFGYQDSVQAVYLTGPDSIWTGTRDADERDGTRGADIMLGLGGNESISGGGRGDFIRGGSGDDELDGNGGSDELQGDGGNDSLDGGNGNDTLNGGAGDDRLLGKGGADLMFGGDGDDLIKGGGGDDTAEGGAGRDRLFGQRNNDVLDGGDGADTVNGAAGNDVLNGGAGNDKLVGGAGNDQMEGDAGRDVLLGGAGDDILRGGDDADRVLGQAGNDIIFSDAGNDREFGGTGDDTFYDSDGNDKMVGGPGADTFLYIDTVFGRDLIRDFEVGVDTLDMGLLARALDATGGDIRASDIGRGSRFAVDRDNFVIVNGVALADFGPDDLILEDPFAI